MNEKTRKNTTFVGCRISRKHLQAIDEIVALQEFYYRTNFFREAVVEKLARKGITFENTEGTKLNSGDKKKR